MIPQEQSSFRLRWNVWVLVLFGLVFLFSTKTLWYDIRVLRRELVDVSRMRSVFLLYASSLVPFLFFVLAGANLGVLVKRFTWVFSAIAVYGLILAAIYQNQTIYILQDVFKLLLVPAGYLSYRLAGRQLREEKLYIFLGLSILLFQVARFLVHSYVKGEGDALVYGTIIDVLPVAVFLAMALETRGLARFACVALMATSLGLCIVGQKRTVLGCIVLMVFFVAAREFLRRRSFREKAGMVAVCAVFLGAGYLGLAATGTLGYVLQKRSFKRIVSTDIQRDIGTESMRFEELRVLGARLEEAGTLRAVFGQGHGATFMLRHPVRGWEEVHSLHFTPAAMLYRYGVVGVLFFCFLFLRTWRCILKGTGVGRSEAGAVVLAAKSYLLCASAACLAIFGLVDDLVVGVCIGSIEGREYGRGSGR